MTLFSTLVTLVILDQLKDTFMRFFKSAVYYKIKVSKFDKEWKLEKNEDDYNQWLEKIWELDD